ncbi:MAG: methyl-accepting chemotaxis protein [Bacteriovoracaceae bacterium]|nr:methyl-accepting chemotaxis protein [Bacteriovoracaceae bacterium]
MSLYKKFMGILSGLSLIIYLYVNVFVINKFQTQMIQRVPESSVKTIYSVIEQYGKKIASKEMTEEQAKNEVLNQIKSIRLSDGNYFWIHNLKNVMVMHPIKPELNGTDISVTKDPAGNSIFVDMTNIVKKNNGEGSYNYLWPKPNEKDSKEKTSFLKLYEPWGWIIGSGMYVEDIKATMSGFINQVRIVLLIIFALSLAACHILVKNIMKGVNETVESLSQTVHDLQNSSQKMNLVSRSLTSSVDRQVSSITESVTAMDEISATIKNNDQSATHAYHLSGLTKNSAESGKKTVDRMIIEMKEISSSYDDIHKNVIENSEEIKKIINVISEIAKKTEVINDIVFQTKLLSFNAAVEAARAGESGKGFAVVAEEVGKLASMSGQAATDINQMLVNSQEQVRIIAETTTSNISQIVSHGRDKVLNGNSVANDCLNELNQIISCVNDQDNSINQISVAIKEQSAGVDEVNKALKHLNDDTTNSVDMSTRSKEASDDLKNQSHRLRVSIQSLRKMLGAKKSYDVAALESN